MTNQPMYGNNVFPNARMPAIAEYLSPCENSELYPFFQTWTHSTPRVVRFNMVPQLELAVVYGKENGKNNGKEIDTLDSGYFVNVTFNSKNNSNDLSVLLDQEGVLCLDWQKKPTFSENFHVYTLNLNKDNISFEKFYDDLSTIIGYSSVFVVAEVLPKLYVNPKIALFMDH